MSNSAVQQTKSKIRSSFFSYIHSPPLTPKGNLESVVHLPCTDLDRERTLKTLKKPTTYVHVELNREHRRLHHYATLILILKDNFEVHSWTDVLAHSVQPYLDMTVSAY